MKGFIMLEMPRHIKIAVPIEDDGQICAFTLKNIVANLEYEDDRRDA